MRKSDDIKYLNYRHSDFLQTIENEENKLLKLFLKRDFQSIQHLR
jgi:hypothetical protein